MSVISSQRCGVGLIRKIGGRGTTFYRSSYIVDTLGSKLISVVKLDSRDEATSWTNTSSL